MRNFKNETEREPPLDVMLRALKWLMSQEVSTQDAEKKSSSQCEQRAVIVITADWNMATVSFHESQWFMLWITRYIFSRFWDAEFSFIYSPRSTDLPFMIIYLEFTAENHWKFGCVWKLIQPTNPDFRLTQGACKPNLQLELTTLEFYCQYSFVEIILKYKKMLIITQALVLIVYLLPVRWTLCDKLTQTDAQKWNKVRQPATWVYLTFYLFFPPLNMMGTLAARWAGANTPSAQIWLTTVVSTPLSSFCVLSTNVKNGHQCEKTGRLRAILHYCGTSLCIWRFKTLYHVFILLLF